MMFKCVTLLGIMLDAAISSTDAHSPDIMKQEVYRLLDNIYQPLPEPSAADYGVTETPIPPGPPGHPWTPKGCGCSIFIRGNMEETLFIIKLMKAAVSFDEFIYVSTKLRNRVNEQLFIYAFITVVISRPDTQFIPIPLLEEIISYWFCIAKVLDKAKQDADNATHSAKPVIVDYEYEKTPGSNESCLAYFREDILINSHHWSWHLLYPSTFSADEERDRHGELFYHLHQQIIARYDIARLVCKLPRVTPFNHFRTPLPEAYFPTLLANLTGARYPGRVLGLLMADVPQFKIIQRQEELHYTWVVRASESGQVNATNGTIYNLVEPEGINTLSNIAESNSASLNPDFYGSTHNRVHLAIARMANPEENPGIGGIMEYPSLSLRDPSFYNWHKAIDNIFDTYKMRSLKYTANELHCPNVVIKKIFVKGSSQANTLETYTKERYANISHGVAFTSDVPILLRVNHLDHESFTHNIVLENTLATTTKVTVRIFIAPKKDHTGTDIPFPEQRRLFIILDIFSHTLQPGEQTIVRRSGDSSLTTATQLSFDQLRQTRSDNVTGSPNVIPTRCLCGWPDSHLLPKGTPEGSPYAYFVMVTDGTDYKEPTSSYCTSAPIFCGAWKSKYPDSKSMGYPFDRSIDAITVSEFSTPHANMKVAEITIKHSEKVVSAGNAIF